MLATDVKRDTAQGQRSAKPLFGGSIPPRASNFLVDFVRYSRFARFLANTRISGVFRDAPDPLWSRAESLHRCVLLLFRSDARTLRSSQVGILWVNKMGPEEILSEYKLRLSLYSELAERLKQCLVDLCKANDVRFHAIEARPKGPQSLYDKVTSNGEYTQLSDITDLAAARIITYFSDDVEMAARIVKH